MTSQPGWLDIQAHWELIRRRETPPGREPLPTHAPEVRPVRPRQKTWTYAKNHKIFLINPNYTSTCCWLVRLLRPSELLTCAPVVVARVHARSI